MSKLVKIEQLRDELFAKGARPGLRTLHTWKRNKIIPHIRIGHLIFFDVEQVRAALANRNTVKAR